MSQIRPPSQIYLVPVGPSNKCQSKYWRNYTVSLKRPKKWHPKGESPPVEQCLPTFLILMRKPHYQKVAPEAWRAVGAMRYAI